MNEKEMGASEIYLAPQTEVFDQAAEIAQTTVADTKYPFILEYDLNEKECLLSVLNAASAVVIEENDSANSMTVSMNMSQLRLIENLDCITRVKTDEGKSMRRAAFDAPQINNEAVVTASAEAQVMTLANDEVMVANEVNVASADDGIAVACVSGCTTENNTKETALEISVERTVHGCICCPGAEQWFKFTVPESKKYTIFTTGSLDTVGTLYDCDGNCINEVNDYEPCGKLNFRIVQNLTADSIYYIKVCVDGSSTGGYDLNVTERALVDYIDINKSMLILRKGAVYELPITSNYTYTGYKDAQKLSELSVSINPNNADERKIWWSKSGDILNISHGWDDKGNRYTHLVVNNSGVAKLCAEDWNRNGDHDECTVCVSEVIGPKVSVVSCIDADWIASSKTMGIDMASEFGNEKSYIVEVPTTAEAFGDCWRESNECMVIHTHGSPEGLWGQYDDESQESIVSMEEIKQLPMNTNIRFIVITACKAAGGVPNDNIAYWLSKRINPNGIVIANTDTVVGSSKEFWGSSDKYTWKVYRNGMIQDDMAFSKKLSMWSAYVAYSYYVSYGA